MNSPSRSVRPEHHGRTESLPIGVGRDRRRKRSVPVGHERRFLELIPHPVDHFERVRRQLVHPLLDGRPEGVVGGDT